MIKPKKRVKTLVAAGAIAASATLSLVNAADASAKTATILGDHTVCAQSLTFYPAYSGASSFALKWGEHFNIYHIYGDGWVLGTIHNAWYQTPLEGMVRNGWFC
jgi:hypothetical protein